MPFKGDQKPTTIIFRNLLHTLTLRRFRRVTAGQRKVPTVLDFEE
jgi:hypothetical protein